MSRRCGKKRPIAGGSCDGETRTRTGDTTIFSSWAACSVLLRRRSLGLRRGLCALPWRVAAHSSAPHRQENLLDLQELSAMARPGLEPGTPRLSAGVSSRRPGRATSQRPLPFARRSSLPTSRWPTLLRSATSAGITRASDQRRGAVVLPPRRARAHGASRCSLLVQAGVRAEPLSGLACVPRVGAESVLLLAVKRKERRLDSTTRRCGVPAPVVVDTIAGVAPGRVALPASCYGTSPSRWAIAAAWPRLAALSLLRMCETWTPAVRTLM